MTARPLVPDLATCSYRALTSEMGVGVSTSVGKPRGWHGSREKGIPSKPFINEIAPYGIFNHKPAYDEATFRRLYAERLEENAPAIDQRIAHYQDEFPGQRLVILCWCTISEPDGFCHRRMAARWLEDRYGIEVPELALVDR